MALGRADPATGTRARPLDHLCSGPPWVCANGGGAPDPWSPPGGCRAAWAPAVGVGRPLVAHWPTTARSLAVELQAQRAERDPSLGIQLLGQVLSAL
jgi:hypothetical protein